MGPTFELVDLVGRELRQECSSLSASDGVEDVTKFLHQGNPRAKGEAHDG